MSYIVLNFFYLLVLAENQIKKFLNKFDPWVSNLRLSSWLCQANVFVLIFYLVQHVAPLIRNGHWHNYFQQLGQAIQGSVQSILLRCLCSTLFLVKVVLTTLTNVFKTKWFQSNHLSYKQVKKIFSTNC